MDARQHLAQVGGEGALVAGVEVAEQQADRHRLGAALAQLGGDAGRLPGAERLDDTAGAGALGGLEKQLWRDQWRRLRGAEPVQLGPVLAGDLQQVGEAAGGDQSGAGAAFLEQRVGADRHPVREGLDGAGRGAGPVEDGLDGGHHPA